jgi:biopolymer transport protein ExbD
MSKFTRKGKKGTPAVSTASLPDIIFMLLFFFMVVTVMRQDDPKVKISKPSATETEKLEKKSLVDYINVGTPIDPRYGTVPKIQLDDSFAEVEDIQLWIKANREKRDEVERPLITTSLKVDSDVQMGIVSDIKQELREAQALKINYSVNKGSALDNQ